MSAKKLPAAELMPHYEELLLAGAELPLVVSGASMTPFLRPGEDTVYLRSADRTLQPGEIAFFHRRDGSHVLHRCFLPRVCSPMSRRSTGAEGESAPMTDFGNFSPDRGAIPAAPGERFGCGSGDFPGSCAA